LQDAVSKEKLKNIKSCKHMQNYWWLSKVNAAIVSKNYLYNHGVERLKKQIMLALGFGQQLEVPL
jgi:hypothetical protein